MSVISSPVRKPRRWLHLWPLALFLLLAVCGSLWLWQAWPQIMMKSIVWQREVNQQMSGLLKAVAENPTKAGGSLLAFSFIYGVLHALGPGHGKIVITTWLATHPSKLKSSINLTLAASLLQGLVAIALVVVVLALFLAVMLDPLIERLEKHGLPRLLTSLSVIVALLLLIVIIISSLSASAPGLIQLSRLASVQIATQLHALTFFLSEAGIFLSTNLVLSFIDTSAILRLITSQLSLIPGLLMR